MIIIYITYVLCLFIGYMTANIVKQFRIGRILREDRKFLNEMKNQKMNQAKVKEFLHIEGRTQMIKRMMSLF